METEKAVGLLRNLHESLDIEVKNWLGGLTSNEEKCKLAKEIIALANNGGGYIFIGFNDDQNHTEIQPEPGELDAFTQDSVSGVVHRYTEPACQVSVQRVTLPESDIAHPIITVPGKHRTPIWAKRPSPNGSNILQTGVVYTRRPGGNSEPARTQDDWEKLIDRLVRARQADLVEAVRHVLDPTEVQAPLGLESLHDWVTGSELEWVKKLENLAEDDVRRYQPGYWTASFVISDFDCDSARELRDFFHRELRSFTGWPPFVVLQEQDRSPVPSGRIIEAWLGAPADRIVTQAEACTSNYWRASIDGHGFVLNPYAEDHPNYCGNRTPRPMGKHFDKIYHPHNVVELLFTIRELAMRFASDDSTYTLSLKYSGMIERTLQTYDLRWGFGRDGQCGVDTVVSEQSGFIATLNASVEEEAFKLLAPVYEYFNFAEVNRHAIRHAIENIGEP